MNKYLHFTIRLILSAVLTGGFIFITNRLEDWSQIAAFDNFIGAAPFILMLVIAALLLVLIWKRHRSVDTLTIVLSALTVISGLLLIPAITGNWYPFAKAFHTLENAAFPQVLEDRTATLPGGNASLHIPDSLPTLDGATALYPVYTSFANAVYDKANITSDTVVCSNTSNAYKKIIAESSDIIFVAGPSQKQKQAAEEAGGAGLYAYRA